MGFIFYGEISVFFKVDYFGQIMQATTPLKLKLEPEQRRQLGPLGRAKLPFMQCVLLLIAYFHF